MSKATCFSPQAKQECDRLGVRQIDAQMRKLMVTLNLPLPSRRKRFAYSGPMPSDNAHELAFVNEADLFTTKFKPTHEATNTIWKLSASEDAADTNTLHSKRPRYKRETTLGEQQGENSTELYFHRMAAEVSEDFARQLHWGAENITWFAYGVYLWGEGDLQVHILLADKTLSSPNATSANLTAAVEQLVQAFQRGEITVDVGGKNLHSGVLSSCEDLDCRRLSLNVTAPPGPPPPTSTATHFLLTWSGLCLTVAVLCWGTRVDCWRCLGLAGV